ncbi:hypothetical protein GCM10027516_22830 [Niabella aquatica]
MIVLISVVPEEITHAAVSLNFTVGFAGKLVPVMVTVSPNCAVAGETAVIFIDSWDGLDGVSFLQELKTSTQTMKYNMRCIIF